MKRGQSGLSLLVAVNKPSGMSSHDVVNACRRIFEEKRVGHTGTLDPLTTGLLPICVGPATKLDRFLTIRKQLIFLGTDMRQDIFLQDLGELQ